MRLGMNTTLESLSNGAPMVAIPVANDQPGVAARIAYTGVGEAIFLKELIVTKLRSAIEKVLTQESYKKRRSRWKRRSRDRAESRKLLILLNGLY
jgi:zeaxanthin glucosyltransferase